jgi:hypothetical protein
MSLRQTFSNPFYLLLLVAGLIFTITACAYGVMTVRGLRQAAGSGTSESLMDWLDEYGLWLMLGELAGLAVCCLLAIATDSYWDKRLSAKQPRRQE